MKLENLNHLIFLLNNDEELVSIMHNYVAKTVYNQLKKKIENINDFEENAIMNQIELKIQTLNTLKYYKTNAISSTYWLLLMRIFYFGLYNDHLDSEDRKYEKKSGNSRFRENYMDNDKPLYDHFTTILTEKCHSNELKNFKQAEQFVIGYLYNIKRNKT